MTTGQTARREASSPDSPPPGWEREVPKYRVSRDLQPAPKARFRFEPPFAHTFDSSSWQFGERPLKANEVVLTTEWPHPSFHPLNYSAAKVLQYFTTRMKSRLPRSPWNLGRLRLDDGLEGPAEVHFVPPQLQQVDLRPRRN